MAHSPLRYALFWQTPVYQSYGSFLYVALRLYIHEDEKSPGSLTDQDQQTGASNFVNIDFLNYSIFFFLHGIPWHIWSRMQRIRGSNHLYFPIKAFCIYVCLQKNPGQKSPEMVDAPEFSQAHLYRLVNMVAGAGFEPTAFGLWGCDSFRKSVQSVQ